MRSFIGINFSRELKEQLARIQKAVRAESLKGSFKHVDNFHITLKFLGEMQEAQTAAIARKLEAIAAQYPSFALKLQDLGCFKGKEGIRTLYIGLGGDTKALLQINREVESAMEEVGFAREKKPYTPHITIAQNLILKEDFEKLKKKIVLPDDQEIRVDKIELIKSEQIQNKRIYTPICGYELQKS